MTAMVLPGDIDGDGDVDGQDLSLLRKLHQGHLSMDELWNDLTPEERARLDTNGDGILSYDDVVALSMKVLNTTPSDAKLLADKLDALRSRIR
jgi:hypothetical protein